VKRALKGYRFKEDDIDQAADIAVNNSYYNPRKIEKNLIRALIRRAYAGEDARADCRMYINQAFIRINAITNGR
jgi:hypothetical protein